jgi:hypothetical protein
MQHITRTATVAYERARLGKSVYLVKNNSKKTAVWTRTEKEVNALFEKEPKSSTEKLMGALWAVIRANFNLVRLFRNWGTLDGLTAMFLREEGLFGQRAAPINKTTHFEQLTFQEYEKEFRIEGPMEVLLMQDAEKHFQTATSELLAWLKETGKKADPLARDALASALAGGQFVKQLNKGKRVCLKNPGKVLFPIFTLSNK